MRKIPTLFRRDPDDMRRVTRDVHPDCRWVVVGEGVATRKYDGTCLLLDEGGWWARRDVKADKQPPERYRPVEFDPITGKTVGWEPIEQSAFVKLWREAYEGDPRYDGIGGGYPRGTYELVGPKVNRNPEGRQRHELLAHAAATVLEPVPRDYDGLAKWLAGFEGEGVVWHHPDGRMAKLKRRDFPNLR